MALIFLTSRILDVRYLWNPSPTKRWGYATTSEQLWRHIFSRHYSKHFSSFFTRYSYIYPFGSNINTCTSDYSFVGCTSVGNGGSFRFLGTGTSHLCCLTAENMMVPTGILMSTRISINWTPSSKPWSENIGSFRNVQFFRTAMPNRYLFSPFTQLWWYGILQQ